MKKSTKLLICISTFIALFSCKEEIYVLDDELENKDTSSGTEIVAGEGLVDWTLDSHSNDSDINYDLVFNQTKVQRIDIVITSEEYQVMETDLANLRNSENDKPVYVACDFFFEGKQWYDVGLRYKGNSSLNNVVRTGIEKLPFRLKFDEFEDGIPEIKNQRFYGFKDLALCSNFNDETLMREKVASDLFLEFGVPAVHTAYYEVYLDIDGSESGSNEPVFYGVYTLDEVVFDTMLIKIFGSETGNCYKPEGSGAAFALEGFDINHFEKKTNEEEGDWSDIQELYDVLHDNIRLTDIESWKSALEKVFDVDGFMKYLAVNNTIENWDTYGNMTHNYYLYHDPADGLIKWISWDNNLALNSDGKKNSVSLGMQEVSDDWPLISFLIDVEEYELLYKNYLLEFSTSIFIPSKLQATYDSWDLVIKSSVEKEISPYSHLINGVTDYDAELLIIKNHVSERVAAVDTFLNE